MLGIVGIFLSSLFIMSQTARYQAHATTGLNLGTPSLLNTNGDVLDTAGIRSQVMLSTTISNPQSARQPFITLFEVRDSNQVTVFLSWVSGTIPPGEQFDLGVMWQPQTTGSYNVRTYAVTDLKNPQILSAAKTATVSVGQTSVVAQTQPTPSQSSGNQNNSNEPKGSLVAGISEFSVQGDGKENGSYTIVFSLFDAGKREISSDGKVSFSITDGMNRQLYNKSFSVTSSQFSTWHYTFTGAEFLGYGWTIPTSEIQKGITSTGTAKIVFTDPAGISFTSTTSLVSIPALSQEEAKQKLDEIFTQTATIVNDKRQNGNIEVTLVKYGMFTHPQFTTYGDVVNEFRVDLIVRNIGTTDEYPPDQFVIIDKQGIQHDKSYGGTLPFSELLAGSTVQGSVLFDSITNEMDVSTFVAKKYSYPQDYIWTYYLS